MIRFNYKTKVYYRDIDQMGVVYYSRYFEYFEAARTELLKAIGLEVTEIENRGYLLPVVSAHCDYSGSARFEDELTVETVIPTKPGARLRIEYRLVNGTGQELVAGYTEHCFTTKTGRVVRPPAFFKACLKAADDQ